MRAPALPALRHFSRGPREGGSWNHRVLARDPPFPRVPHEWRHGFFDRCRANHARVSYFDQHRAFSRGNKVRSDDDGTKLVRRAVIRTKKHDAAIVNELVAWSGHGCPLAGSAAAPAGKSARTTQPKNVELKPDEQPRAAIPTFEISNRGQGLIEIVENVLNIFNAYRNADQAIGEADGFASLLTQCCVRHGGGMGN